MNLDDLLLIGVGLIGLLLLLLILYVITNLWSVKQDSLNRPHLGQCRFNELNISIEMWNGDTWETLPSPEEPFEENTVVFSMEPIPRDFPHGHWKNPERLSDQILKISVVEGISHQELDGVWVPIVKTRS